MSFSVKYIKLFNLLMLNDYFLDKGTEEFSAMSDEDKQHQLDAFDFQRFFNIFPTRNTRQLLDGYSLSFGAVNTGFSIWARVDETDDSVPYISLDDDLDLTFIIQIADFRYLNYTLLKQENAGKVYYFSNQRLADESPTFPLIPKQGDNPFIDETFVLSDPVALNQLETLSTGEKDDLFGIIRIHMKGETSAYDITDASGKIPATIQSFELHLDNRETFWRYIFRSDQTVAPSDDVELENSNSRILITKTEKPLTYNGFVPVELGENELPNPDVNQIKPDETENKIYSEIYM